MRKLFALGLLALLGVAVVGCSSSDATADAPPKGNPPNTTTAPPGTPGPEERTTQGTQDGGK